MSKWEQKLIKAAKEGDLKLIQREECINSADFVYLRNEIATHAAFHGHLHILEWVADYLMKIKTTGLPEHWINKFDRWHVIDFAAQGGQLHVLKWCEKNGITWTRRTVIRVIQEGHLHVLQWMVDIDGTFFLDEDRFAEAAECGHWPILHFLLDMDCPRESTACDAAARAGRLDVLQWLRMSNVPWTNNCYISALSNGHLSVAKWIKAQPWSDRESPWRFDLAPHLAPYNNNWLFCAYHLYDVWKWIITHETCIPSWAGRMLWVQHIDTTVDQLPLCSSLCSLIKTYI